MFNLFKRSKPVPSQEAEESEPHRNSLFSTDGVFGISRSKRVRDAIALTFRRSVKEDVAANVAMDSVATMDNIESAKASMVYNMGGIPDQMLSWYGSQGFIGYQACAMIGQHWLVSKACAMPARDAIRKGYEITVNDGTEVEPEVLDYMRQCDKKYKLNKNLVEFIKMGRMFGLRVAMFKISSSDREYYEKPFNLDGITPGSYKGISQIDPYWMAPELDQSAASDPSAIDFYEPTYWTIGGKRIHKSHLIIFKGDELPDILKPAYLYGGLSIPQKIYERVYGAERTANEGPQLAMTKRTIVYGTDVEKAMMNQAIAETKLQQWAYYRDNYGVKLVDSKDETMQQFDTALGDLDTTIMTQYQLVASIANVPATKLLGTSPKGFNATGEYEAENYREELESIQANDMAALINRHHEILIRSEVCPKFKISPFSTDVVFEPLDSMTEAELADVNLKEAQRDQVLQATGAISGEDIRNRLINDPRSGYNGLTDEPEDDYADTDEEPIEEENEMGKTVQAPSSEGNSDTQ